MKTEGGDILRDNERGLTLVELIVVIVILSLLTAIVTTNVTNNILKAKQTAARAQISELGNALDHYKLDTGVYPSTQEGLRPLLTNPGVQGWDGPYLRKSELPLDPWGKPYKYAHPGQHGEFDIYTYGQDDAPGGEKANQDLGSWN